MAKLQSRAKALASVVVRCVQLGEPRRFYRQFFQRVDGIRRAHRNAGAAIDAIGRIDEELRNLRKTALILLRVNAVNRAGLHAQFVLGTGIGNDVCHMAACCNCRASGPHR